MKLLYIVAVINILFVGCQTNPLQKEIIYIHNNDIKSKVDIQSVFTEVDLIELEDRESPLGQILKVIHLEDRYIALIQHNDYNQRYVAGFNEAGKTLFFLNPNESNFFNFNPRDIARINNSFFELIDGSNNSLVRFDLNGRLVSKRALNIKVANFEYDEESDYYVFYKNFQVFNEADTSLFYNLIFTDSTFNIVQKYFPFSIEVGERAIVSFLFPLQKSKSGKIWFAKIFSDSIYCFENAHLSTDNTIVFRLPGIIEGTVTSNHSKIDIQELLENNALLLAGWYIIAKDHISFNLVAKDKPAWGLYHFSTGTLNVGGYFTTNNGVLFPSPIGITQNEYFISALNEFSVQYLPDFIVENDFVNEMIKKGKTYLLIAK